MTEELQSEIINGVGILTLNAPKSLNSLTTAMVQDLYTCLMDWQKDERVSCVFLQGSGEKAFCAGGDVRRMYDAVTDPSKKGTEAALEGCIEFFSKEYRVDHLIHRYTKPIVVWGDGIVMGGGMGLLAGASHRVVTEKSRLAMPEITIGLFPDVGGSWFLNRLSSGWGLYLALTGARFSGVDAHYLDLANYFLPSQSKAEVLKALENLQWTHDLAQNHELVENALTPFSSTPALSEFAKHSFTVSNWIGLSSVIEYRAELAKAAAQESWFAPGLKTLDAGSPSSACIIFEQLRHTRNYTLEDVFRSELNLAVQCCKHPDFAEGVRALLVDKDQNPKWSPAKLSDISKEWVASYFKPLWKKEEHPLKGFKAPEVQE